ncbi:MAG: hypothetical protein EXR73_05765 [Myxococcales bacterium]|nr:hypothetical protein [Myxococcales bacterium]
MAFSDAQLRRYARQIVLPDVGGVGQERLLAAAVRVEHAVGAGAAAILYLAAAGVGRIVVTDGGVVDAAGWLYEASDVGRARLDAAVERVAEQNPDVRVVASGPWDVTVELADGSDGGDGGDGSDGGDGDGARAAGRAIRSLLA